MRVLTVSLKSLKKPTDDSTPEGQETLEPLRTPWGSYVNVELSEAAPQVDFVIRRRKMPSEVSIRLSVSFWILVEVNCIFIFIS